MNEPIFQGITEEGETVEFTLSSLMNAKYNTGEKSIRTASEIGEVSVLVETICDSRIEQLKIERDYFQSEAGKMDAVASGALDAVNKMNSYAIDLDNLRSENLQLRTALEEYADRANWDFSEELRDVWNMTPNGYEYASDVLNILQRGD